jgi:hypothetical protein
MAVIQAEITELKAEIKKVEEGIEKVEEEIAKVQEELRPLEEKALHVRTEEEKAEIDRLSKREQQLRDLLLLKESRLRDKESGLRDKESDLREDKKRASSLPLLGDAESMYDIWARLSSRSSAKSSESFSGPAYNDKTGADCPVFGFDPVPRLDEHDFKRVLGEPNRLWEVNYRGCTEAVDIGSTEAVVDNYVAKVIKSVANALKLDIRLEQQSYVNGVRADHWIVKVLNLDKVVAILVGTQESKLPVRDYGKPFVLDDTRFLLQIRRQMLEVSSYYGTTPVYGIGSTGREWRFFQLRPDQKEEEEMDVEPKTPGPSESPVQVATPGWDPKSSTREENRSPPTINIGPDNMDEEFPTESAELGEIQKIVPAGLLATQVYKWDDLEMLRVLGGFLKAMYQSTRAEFSVFSPEMVSSRLMWFLVKHESLQAWGWGKLKVNALCWQKRMREGTAEVVVLLCLGHGADGKALLVSNRFGEVGVMKLCVRSDWGRAKSRSAITEAITPKELDSGWKTAQIEAENWKKVYRLYDWAETVRAERWMGLPAVVMPHFYQFKTRADRENSLVAVQKCLEEKFVQEGYVHEDVAWRNVGYFKKGEEIVVVMLDLCGTRVKSRQSSEFPVNWVETAIEYLRSRCSL